MRPDCLAVLGLGALGGSLAWRARLSGIPRVIGFSPEPAQAVEALKAGAITEIADRADKTGRQAQLVVLATPPRTTMGLLPRVAPRLPPDALVMDLAGVKAPVLECAASNGLADRFVGTHPLAGNAFGGFAEASADRFRGAIVYVTPGPSTAAYQAARQVMAFWEHTLEAHPVLTDAPRHDRQVAWTTQLPQAVAAALAATLAGSGIPGVSFGEGARAMTRLAGQDPGLTLETLLLNREAVAEALARTEGRLQRLRELLLAGDAGALRVFLEAGSDFRQSLD